MNTVYPAYGTVILHLYDSNKEYGYTKFDDYLKDFIELIPINKNPKPCRVVCIINNVYWKKSKKT